MRTHPIGLMLARTLVGSSMTLLRLAVLSVQFGACAVVLAQGVAKTAGNAPVPSPAAVETIRTEAASNTESGTNSSISTGASTADAAIEPDLSEQKLSNAAQVRLDRARDSVVQIRGFYGGAQSSAFHGSGFAMTADGLIVTNYHVVADAVLYPRRYRLEYVTAAGNTGKLQVYAIDVKNDLAIVRSDDLQLPPLRVRAQIPSPGERAYSIGYPLNLGLTITEGVANGLVANSSEQRIHYTGAINAGMSGGPALDASGAVYGVNVSVVTGRQLVGFVVPAKHIPPLLIRAREPLHTSNTPRQARELVASQVLTHQARMFAGMFDKFGTQTLFGYTLPTQISPSIECSTIAGAESNPQLHVERISCSLQARLLIQAGLAVGNINIQHRILHSQTLHPLQFSQAVNREAAAYVRTGSEQYVAPFACENALVSLDGFDARISTCARQYRLFANLYDLAVTVVSINNAQHAAVSHLDLHGVGFEPGIAFVRRYLGAMRWTP